MKKSIISLAIGLAIVSSSALAGGGYDWALVTTGSTSKNNTNAYAGLNWSMGGSWTPAVVLGLFRTHVKADGDTQGANLAFHLNLAGGIKPGKLKLSYLNGKENLQGEIGAGYDFARSAPLLGFGLNGPFVAAGVDGYLSQGLVPYVTLQSQGKFSKPSYQNTTACVNTGSGPFPDSTCTPD
ncbi:MAG: hypothetical protein HGA71_05340 [Azonexaceae bacterium]|nr:hypothetical protein [Azonexaceae bacterium]